MWVLQPPCMLSEGHIEAVECILTDSETINSCFAIRELLIEVNLSC